MNYKVGDRVLCIKESDVPAFIGKIYVVAEIVYGHNNHVRLINVFVNQDDRYGDKYNALNIFPFFLDEIVPESSLIKELL